MTDSTYKKHCLVIDEWFINGWNGVKAYKKFYPNSKYESADSSFREILENSRIKDYVKAKKESALITLKTSHEALLNELEKWAYSDITETLMLSPEEVKQLPSDIKRLITKFKHTKREIKNNEGKVVETIEMIELHFVSKERAMEMIHKHTEYYKKDNKQKTLPVMKVIDMSNYKKENDNE